jgi:hypothetical protein
MTEHGSIALNGFQFTLLSAGPKTVNRSFFCTGFLSLRTSGLNCSPLSAGSVSEQ